MKNIGKMFLFLGAVLLGGCVQVAPSGEDSLEVAVPGEWTTRATGTEPHGWLADFGDPQLQALIGEALGGNLQLQSGMARLDQAMALARIEGADRLPALSLTGSAQRSMGNNLQDPPVRNRSDRFELGAVVSWELDVWGRVRAQALAANADAEAAEADFQALRLSLANRVARAWFNAIEARQQEALALETLNSFEANLKTVEERFNRGLTPALDLRLTRANVATARSTHALQKRLADSAVRQLEVLLGRYPSGSMVSRGELPALEDTIPAGLPSGLLSRRPDIRASARRLMAADSRLIESERALLPSLSLTARYGSASGELENLLEDPFDVWSLLGNLSAPLFQGGRLRANVDLSEARRQEALANYRDTVLTAFREVESSLAGETYIRDQLEALRLSAEESIGAQELAEERYEGGLTDIVTVLESQRRAFTARSAMLAVHNQLLQNRLSLYLALGGEFSE